MWRVHPEMSVANRSSFLSPQFSQALAIRSYTKFVMGVSQVTTLPTAPWAWEGFGRAALVVAGGRPWCRMLAQCAPAPWAQVGLARGH